MYREPLFLLIAGCSFAPRATGDGGPVSVDAHADARAADGAGGEVGTDAARGEPCMQRWHDKTVAFDPPVELTALEQDTTVYGDPFVTFDELTIYFGAGSSGGGQEDIYLATRSAIDATFAAPQLFAPANSPDNESKMSVTQDGNTFAIASSRAGDHGGALEAYQFTNSGGSYSTPSEDHFGAIDGNGNNNTYDPSLSLDGDRLYYAPTLNGDPQHIYVVDRDDVQPDFGNLDELDTINSTDNGSNNVGDADPALSPDESVIVFSSQRDSIANGVDIYYATRAVPTLGTSDPSQGFGTPTKVTSVNTPVGEGDPVLGADGCRLYFSSNRTGSTAIFEATMTTP